MIISTIQTPNGKIYRCKPDTAQKSGPVPKEQWTTNPNPGSDIPPKSTPSMARVRRLLPEIDTVTGTAFRTPSYVVIIWGVLKRSGSVVYPEGDEPTVTKSASIPRGELTDLLYGRHAQGNTLNFANAVVAPYGYEWKQIYSIAMRPQD